MKHDVFVSYSRRDLAAVKPIKEELEAAGFSCWMDLEGIESGSDEFTQNIVSAIETSTAILFFLSSSSQASEWSLKELRFAKNSNKRAVLVRFNDDAMTSVFSFNYGGSDLIDWRIPEQKRKLLRDLFRWTGKVPRASSDGRSPPNPAIGVDSGSRREETSDRPCGEDSLPHDAKDKAALRRATYRTAAFAAPFLILMIFNMSNYDEFSDKMEVVWILLPVGLFPLAGLIGSIRSETLPTFSRRLWKGVGSIAIVNVATGIFCAMLELVESDLIGTFCFVQPIACFILARLLFWKSDKTPGSKSSLPKRFLGFVESCRFAAHRIRSAFSRS